MESQSTCEKFVETSSLQGSPILQVDGNNDELRAESSLAPFSCESESLSAVINVFRSFSKPWENSSDHGLCMTKSGLRCLFCGFRSFALRLDAAKTKHFLKPVEIISQVDQLPDEQIYKDNVVSYLSEMIKKIQADNNKLSNLILGKYESCGSCSSQDGLCDDNIIFLPTGNTSNIDGINLGAMVEKWLTNQANEHKTRTDCSGLVTNNASHYMINMIVALDYSKTVDVPDNISVAGQSVLLDNHMS